MVQPPRSSRKVGVFASRAPHRPNPIGLSCLELISIEGLRLNVGPHDLLDGTPILDIKPYLPYADAFPDAQCGWVGEVDDDFWEVRFSSEAEQQLAWLEEAGVSAIRTFVRQQLREHPFNRQRKRIRPISDTLWEIAYRTWRVRYAVDYAARQVRVDHVSSAYATADLEDTQDVYGDKAIHREYRDTFPAQWNEDRPEH